MTGLIVFLVVIGIFVGAAYASKHVKHPEQTASEGEAPVASDSERFYRGVDRPAGPDAEDPIFSDQDPPPP